MTYALEVRKGLVGPIDIEIAGLPSDASASLSIETPTEGQVSILTIGNLGNVSPGNYMVDVTFSDALISQTEQFELIIPGNLPAPTNLSSQILGLSLIHI